MTTEPGPMGVSADGPLALVQLAGIRPIMVSDLGTPAILLLKYGLVLIDEACEAVALESLVDQVLDKVLEQATADAAS